MVYMASVWVERFCSEERIKRTYRGDCCQGKDDCVELHFVW